MVKFQQTLKTESVGRLMIYTHILKSTTYVVKTKYKHGFAVVSRLLTEGKGRGGNKVRNFKSQKIQFELES